MVMSDLVRIGSETAKSGFANERDIAAKFKAWKNDIEAQKWLVIMHYDLKQIEEVDAIILHGYKTDVQVKIIIKMKNGFAVENISIKKTNIKANFNQIDKRWVDHYKKMWDIPNDITELLKRFTGEITPEQLLKEGNISETIYKSLRDKRRFFLDEFDSKDTIKVVNFFKNNKIQIVADLIKGNDKFAADWMLVTLYEKVHNTTTWALADINKALSIFGDGDVKISPHGSLFIGHIFMQRKGGDGGRKSSQMLQFKIKPSLIFD